MTINKYSVLFNQSNAFACVLKFNMMNPKKLKIMPLRVAMRRIPILRAGNNFMYQQNTINKGKFQFC
jgi:hypothetical protein